MTRPQYALRHPSGSVTSDLEYLCKLTPTQAEEAREEAWGRFWRIPHADPNVGRDTYHAELRAIVEREQP